MARMAMHECAQQKQRSSRAGRQWEHAMHLKKEQRRAKSRTGELEEEPPCPPFFALREEERVPTFSYHLPKPS
jgi:hypothetical protein